MDKIIFTASNGFEIKEDEGGNISGECGVHIANSAYALALREFFQAERDEELGRWRWPENPDYVVYRTDPVCISVIDEKDGCEWVYYRGGLNFTCPDLIAEAGEAYFVAHPEPKPWHDAKEGEVWVVDTGDSEERPMIVADYVEEGLVFNDAIYSAVYEVKSPEIQGARRIWPEPEQEEA